MPSLPVFINQHTLSLSYFHTAPVHSEVKTIAMRLHWQGSSPCKETLKPWGAVL